MGKCHPLDGRIVEERARLFLKFLGWHIIAHNVRVSYECAVGTKRTGEIDIIAYRRPVVAFVEVKARSHINDAMNALAPRQRRRITRAAEAWLSDNTPFSESFVRFDCIVCDRRGLLVHIPDAWHPWENSPLF